MDGNKMIKYCMKKLLLEMDLVRDFPCSKCTFFSEAKVLIWTGTEVTKLFHDRGPDHIETSLFLYGRDLRHEIIKYYTTESSVELPISSHECDVNAEWILGEFRLPPHCVKKGLYSDFFWSVFSRIWTEYWETRSISLCSVRMRENTDQKNSEYRQFLRSAIVNYFLFWT